jgi:hypothetical protein
MLADKFANVFIAEINRVELLADWVGLHRSLLDTCPLWREGGSLWDLESAGGGAKGTSMVQNGLIFMLIVAGWQNPLPRGE